MTEFYRFICAAEGEPDSAELLVFAPIGDWEDMGEIGAKGFARDLSKLPSSVKRLDIHINSPGGSLFEASAIYSRLADHRSTKHVYVDGIAASAATIIAMVGHKIFIRANATMMIHMPSGFVMGNAKDMRSVAGALDTVTESMINIYEKRTGQTRNSIREMLEAESWFDPEQAVELGFADEVRGVVKAAAALGDNRYEFDGHQFDLSRFHNIPANLATNKERKPMQKKVMIPSNAEGGGESTDPPEHVPPTPSTPPRPSTTPPGPSPTPTPPQPVPPGQVPPQPTPAGSYDDGIAAERARIAALQKLDRPATHKIVAEAIQSGKTAADIFEDVMAAMDQAQAQSGRRADARQLDGIPPADGGLDKDNAFADALKNKVKERIERNRLNRTHAAHSRN